MKALIVVDVQNDFCPDGNLAVADGAKIIPAINKLMENDYDMIVATQDWHPKNHISFAETHNKNPFDIIDVYYGKQVLWPTHCVQETTGSEFHKELNQDKIKYIVRKGDSIGIDSYSAFLENDKKTKTGLERLLEDCCEIHVVGIATDVCVMNTAIDAKNVLDVKVKVFKDCCAGVTQELHDIAIDKMKNLGIIVE